LDYLDDTLGVRVITYIEPDVANVVSALTGQFRFWRPQPRRRSRLTKACSGTQPTI